VCLSMVGEVSVCAGDVVIVAAGWGYSIDAEKGVEMRAEGEALVVRP
jgi:hypothetical protein